MMKVIIGVVIFVFTIVSGLQMIEKNKASFYASLNQENLSTDFELTEEEIKITLTGNIKDPGTYTIEKGSFLESALELAGGVLDDTDYDAFNLYLVLENDIQIYIPKVSDETKISINEADVDALQDIPNIGLTLANRIVQYRNEIGIFSYLEQLLDVQGIGTKIFNKIRDFIIL